MRPDARPRSLDVLLELVLYHRASSSPSEPPPWSSDTPAELASLLLSAFLCALKLLMLLLLVQLSVHLIPDDSHAYVLGYMRAAHPAAVPFLLGADHAHAGRSGSAGSGSAGVSAQRLRPAGSSGPGSRTLLPTTSISGVVARRGAGAGVAPTGAAAFGHLYRASVLLLITSSFSSVHRLDPSVALAAMGAHCACFPAKRHLSVFWMLLVLSLAADALWLHAGTDSPLEQVGGLLAIPPMCGLGDVYNSWHSLKPEERGGLETPPQLLPWATSLPPPELAAVALVVFNAPLKLVVSLFTTHALWRVRREAEDF